ncbi:MAG: hypothetical protein Q9160_008379 [Pyrenula sp. 1 TL-2023]
MDVNQVLESTLSPDATTRQNAEQQLSHAAEVDFAGYLTTLGRELANEQAQPHIRTAAGLALKNAFSSRDAARLREVQGRWVQQIQPEIKKQVKDLALQTLGSDPRAGQSAAQLIASIAAIELPRNQWPDLMPALVQNVGQGNDILKQNSLTAIGYICDTEDLDLRESLSNQSNAILTAVVQGARKEEPNNDVRYAALSALGDATEFIRSNFENEGERNYIMQVICEATQAPDTRIQSSAFGCLNRVMGLYYDKMRFYMEKALFGLTAMGMKNEEEDVAKLAIEFWCTVCEEEISIEDDNAAAQAEGSVPMRQYFQFARISSRQIVPELLNLLTKVDEDDADDDYNVARAAYQCLQLYASCIGADVIQPVLEFVEANLRAEDWHNRDAAVAAFGAIMDGPPAEILDPLVKQALPVLIGMMDDSHLIVKDSAAYALSRICDFCNESIEPETHLAPLMNSLFNGLMSNPKMAASCCLALMNLAERFTGEGPENLMTKHFESSVSSLLQVTESSGANSQLRTAAYEVLCAFITNAAESSLPIVGKLSTLIIQRFEQTIPMQQQVVSLEDRLMLEELQISLASVLLAIVQRLEDKIAPQADQVMQTCFEVLKTVPPKSGVPDTVFAVISAVATSLERDFLKYMDMFAPFLYGALGNQDEPGLCSVAIGVVSDVTRALGELVQPFCDTFMNYLLNNLRSQTLSNQLKPAILECFGDIASTIGPQFEKYLQVVAQVLQQAAGVSVSQDVGLDLWDYIVSLREGIADAWGGIILAFKVDSKAELVKPYIEAIFQLVQAIAQDQHRSEGLLRATLGIIGDLAEMFPGGEISSYYQKQWVSEFIKEVRTNREFSPRTTDTARWAREQVKKQLSAGTLMQ